MDTQNDAIFEAGYTILKIIISMLDFRGVTGAFINPLAKKLIHALH